MSKKLNNNDIQKKADETFKTHSKLTENINLININKKELQKKLEETLNEKDRINQKMCGVKVSIEERKLVIESALSGGDFVTIDNLTEADVDKKCSKILDHFIGPRYEDNEINQNLCFVIKSNYETLKKLNDYETTFGKLKDEYCKINDLRYEDTYFTDEEDNIFLDSMIIKECLFPLDNYVLNDAKPVIKVVINKIKIGIVENDDENEKLKKVKNDFNKDHINKYYSFLKYNCWILTHITCLLVFIFVWIYMLVSLQDIKSNKIIKKTVDIIQENYFNKAYDVSRNFEYNFKFYLKYFFTKKCNFRTKEYLKK
jgi:hypothetical protein